MFNIYLYYIFDQQIAEALVLMRKRIHEDKDAYADIVLVDWVFFNKLKNLNVEPDDYIAKYIIGLYPRLYGKPWTGVKRIYTPFMFGDNHWAALEIILETHLVNVYDCNHPVTNEHKVISGLAHFCEQLKRIMKNHNFFGEMDDTPFSVVRIPALPHNHDG